jgi:GTP-binding protein
MTKTDIPSVVLIGRTNAGKSTLFNRLTEEEKAIVSSAENTTRDQTRGKIYWKGAMCELVDTGGLDTAELDSLHQEIQRQVHMAVEKASAIIFVVDGKGELMPQDRETGRWLQQLGNSVY